MKNLNEEMKTIKNLLKFDRCKPFKDLFIFKNFGFPEISNILENKKQNFDYFFYNYMCISFIMFIILSVIEKWWIILIIIAGVLCNKFIKNPIYKFLKSSHLFYASLIVSLLVINTKVFQFLGLIYTFIIVHNIIYKPCKKDTDDEFNINSNSLTLSKGSYKSMENDDINFNLDQDPKIDFVDNNDEYSNQWAKNQNNKKSDNINLDIIN